ncbi:MAG: helix-turn-helix transcriptional regulator [Candidatus Parcubacteria bacterium]|nr:helix-turn-helix transcriptional regulator [Candidatus Parcubacteria bacterium]
MDNCRYAKIAGKCLRQLREEAGYKTREDAAAKTSLTVKELYYWEEIAPPLQLTEIFQLCCIYNIKVSEFFAKLEDFQPDKKKSK